MNKIKLIAFIAALLTAFGIYFLLNTASKPKTASKTDVVVAAVSIAANTTVTKDMVKISSVPTETVLPGAVRDSSLVIGAVLKTDAVAGEQILSSRLAKAGKSAEDTLAYAVTPGMRAITIAVDNTKGLSSLIRPQNKVDLIAQFQTDQIMKKADGTAVTKTAPMSKILLQNIKVLAVDQTLSKDAKPGSSGYSTITLEVTPQQAVELSFSAKTASLQAILRSPVDDKQAAVPQITEKDVVGN